MIRNSITKILAISLIVGLSWFGLSAMGETLAYYNDTENSTENTFSAGSLDFSLNDANFDRFIGLDEIILLSPVLTNSGSLDFQYTIEAEKISGSDDFCGSLLLEAKLNGVKKYDESLMPFSASASTTGTWKFYIEMPVSAANIHHGDVCEIDLVFKGWQTDIANYDDGGFFDEERIHIHLTSRMIVLNEFLPNPEGYEYGFDFGNNADAMPRGEWVELYNNSDYNFNLAGYYLTNANGNRIDVEGCRIETGNTIIPSKGFLVVYRKGGDDCTSHNFSLNNDGDTVKLFDNANRLIDSYAYTSHDYCNLEPTPGDENSNTTGSGTCGQVPPNKSYARIPDGIGDWVDPIPTPGRMNVLEGENVPAVSEEEIFEEPVGEEKPDEEEATPVPSIEDGATGQVTEENQEQGGIVEKINEIIDEVIDEIVDEIMPVEETGDEVVSELEAPVIEDALIIEEALADEALTVEEQPIIEEQPATLPDDSSSIQDEPAESDSDGGTGDGGGDTSGSLDTGESSGESGDAGDSVSE